MRLFIAILLDKAVKDGICSVMEEMRAHSVRGNFTRRENLHLTLAFLGETKARELPALRKVMESAAGGPFTMEFGGIGYFPRREGPLYYLEVRRTPALLSLQSRLRDALSGAGYRTEDKAFRPHLTLGRTVVLERGFSAGAVSPDLPGQPVSRFCLMESRREAGRLVYTPLFETPLEQTMFHA